MNTTEYAALTPAERRRITADRRWFRRVYEVAYAAARDAGASNDEAAEAGIAAQRAAKATQS